MHRPEAARRSRLAADRLQRNRAMRLGMTKCTPMAPVSGPLTHGVPCTQPSCDRDIDVRESRRRVARTLSISGVVSPSAQATGSIASGIKMRQCAECAQNCFEAFMVFSHLLVEVRIEDANLGDLRDG